MSKYIIKNCPAYDEGDCISPIEHIPHATACQHIEDCKLKQIVEKCKYYQKKIGRTPQHRAGFVDATNDILQLLDIQEVE